MLLDGAGQITYLVEDVGVADVDPQVAREGVEGGRPGAPEVVGGRRLERGHEDVPRAWDVDKGQQERQLQLPPAEATNGVADVVALFQRGRLLAAFFHRRRRHGDWKSKKATIVTKLFNLGENEIVGFVTLWSTKGVNPSQPPLCQTEMFFDFEILPHFLKKQNKT